MSKYTPQAREAFKKWYHSEKGRSWYESYKPKHQAVGREYRLRIKQQALEGYGGKCSCCGETRQEFLTIDHVGGWGREHRRNGRRILGTALHLEVIKQGFPDTFQVLCYNCNCSRGHQGYCPHDLERGEAVGF